ncbi:hypothetical protein L9F63_000301 [Diploptera punctata]|uniref:Uncharacterized protein n=1 Tax=Diploptera punctata TaxID=6984 RepID=A0AAD8ESU6_DIPPU|nr:hypothetical protein L9F63_000301 [Diploptera punctata]
MIFYPTRRNNHTVRRLSTPRPLSSDNVEATHITWMLKSFVMGIALLGLSYWLVQIAGVQYLASLTSATLLAFLLAYVVWCLFHKTRISRQSPNSPSRVEAGNTSTLGATTEPLTPTPPPPFDHHQAYKFNTPFPPRDSSPPPTYEEAVRAMLAMSVQTPTLYATPHSSVTESTVSAFTISPTSAFTPTSPPSVVALENSTLMQREHPVEPVAMIPRSELSLPVFSNQESSQIVLTQSQQTLSALSQQILPTSSALTQETSSALTQEATSALMQIPQPKALTPRGSSSSLEESKSSPSSSTTQFIPAAVCVQETTSGIVQAEGPNSRPQNFQPPGFTSTRTRQPTPPLQPPKSPSVYEIGDISWK